MVVKVALNDCMCVRCEKTIDKGHYAARFVVEVNRVVAKVYLCFVCCNELCDDINVMTRPMVNYEGASSNVP
jgi:hypothetical protein